MANSLNSALSNFTEMANLSSLAFNETMFESSDNFTEVTNSSLLDVAREVYPPLSSMSTEWYNKTLMLWNEGDVNETCKKFFVIADNLTEDIKFVRWLMYVILFPTVAVIGTIGNFINLLVLRRFKARTYVYLYWLAVSDLITMLLDFLVIWRVWKAPSNGNWGYLFCNVTPATSSWFIATSSHMVLVITIERFYAVCFPMSARTNKEGLNPTLVSFFCLLLGFIILYPSRYILMTQTVGLQTLDGFTPVCYVCRYVKLNGFLNHYYRFRGTITRTVPTIIVAFLNTCTIIALKRHQRNRSSALNQKPGPKEQAEDRIKLIIMSITTIAVLCYTPTCIKDIFIPPNGKSSLWYETFRLGALLLLHVNTACNFYVYCMCSPAIRQELRKMMRTAFFRSNQLVRKTRSPSNTGSTSTGSAGTDVSKKV